MRASDADSVDRLRTPPHSLEALGVETVFAALFFAAEDAPTGKLSADTEKAFDRLWALQIRDGIPKYDRGTNRQKSVAAFLSNGGAEIVVGRLGQIDRQSVTGYCIERSRP